MGRTKKNSLNFTVKNLDALAQVHRLGPVKSDCDWSWYDNATLGDIQTPAHIPSKPCPEKCAVVDSSKLRVRPILRWAGSKRKQLYRLRQFWGTEHARYVEPFAGSACLFFDVAPPDAILGDINEDLIRFYSVVRKSPEEVHSRLLRLSRDPMTFARWRKKAPSSLDGKTRALRFLYLNRNCFNGIYRTNSQGGFNVPFGYGSGTYPSREDFLTCASRLRAAKLVSGDFGKTLQVVEKGDFVYIDPPFAVQSRRIFREYGMKSFSPSDIERLASKLTTIDDCGAHFLVSYADCAEARKIALDWNAVRFRIRRNVAGFVDRRRNAFEWLITNMRLPEDLRSCAWNSKQARRNRR